MIAYISGPITGNDNYKAQFAAAQAQLEAKGWTVINPAELDAAIPLGIMEHREYIQIDLALLRKADCLVLLDGWEESSGANTELAQALTTGIYVKTLAEIVAEPTAPVDWWQDVGTEPPQKDGMYQISVKTKNNFRFVTQAFYGNGKWHNLNGLTVEAWQDLPEVL
jgi:hypothetical protein